MRKNNNTCVFLLLTYDIVFFLLTYDIVLRSWNKREDLIKYTIISKGFRKLLLFVVDFDRKNKIYYEKSLNRLLCIKSKF